MKKPFKSIFMFLFFCMSFSAAICVSNSTCFSSIKNSYSFSQIEENSRVYNIKFNDKKFTFYSDDLIRGIQLSDIQKKYIKNSSYLNNSIDKLFSFGLTIPEVCNYICPESKIILEKLSNKLNVSPEPDTVQVKKNSCCITFNEGKDGRFIDTQQFYEDLLEQVLKSKKQFNINLEVLEYKEKSEIQKKFKEKSCFSTNFNTSSAERKNNIRLALSKFDGIILEEGETLSFNKTTGVRNSDAGYMAAKIISNGTFIDGFGGGVCQVSTTLYNACLLAGLEILEVHNHSLPVSYVEPSFDAMVNSGSSDLVVRNNTNGKLIITTSYANDICKVKIFGLKNKYKITRISEKTKIIPAEAEIIDKNYEKYGNLKLEVGEEKRLSYAKDGYFSNAYLNYYDERGNLIRTQKIRENKYNPTKGIVVKREK